MLLCQGNHFGRPEQPYFRESLAWLKNEVEGKTVYCRPVRRDQYNRTVSCAFLDFQ